MEYAAPGEELTASSGRHAAANVDVTGDFRVADDAIQFGEAGTLAANQFVVGVGRSRRMAGHGDGRAAILRNGQAPKTWR